MIQFLLARLREWWKSFVKRHIIDDAPENDEGHSATRTLDEVNERRGRE